MRLISTLRTLLLAVTLLALHPLHTANASTFTALVVGDSISAAYGLRESQGWVALAEQSLRDKGHQVSMVNASISGDTTIGGLRRLPDALERFDPDLLIIELGGNDGLRGYSTSAMRENIEGMAKLAQERGAEVLILGMLIPSNYGQAYLQQFAKAFMEAADNTDSHFVPFLLEPIAQDASYFQSDGIHPTAEAQPLLAEHVMPKMLDILEPQTAIE